MIQLGAKDIQKSAKLFGFEDI